jgi:hypothetical protein
MGKTRLYQIILNSCASLDFVGSCFGGICCLECGYHLVKRLKVDWDDGATEVEVDEPDL